MDILFSVIIPTYNRGDSLIKVLNSLVNQTYKNFEVIVCDDGSVDNTEEVVNSFKDIINVKYFWMENWGGPARPRNIGINKSVGKWICFLDSDDWWYSNKLESCLPFINEYDLIYHSLDIFDCNKQIKTYKKIGKKLNSDVLKNLIINGNVIPNSSVVVNKSLLLKAGNISEEKSLVAVEDYDMWLRIAKITSKFKFINKSLGAYSWDNKTNISHISIDRITKEINILNEYLPFLNKKNQKEATFIFNYKLGRYYGLLNQNYLAKKHLLNSVKSKNIINKIKSFYYYLLFSLKTQND
jgi:glycosyltransferase involved in cell wall biosynthesis